MQANQAVVSQRRAELPSSQGADRPLLAIAQMHLQERNPALAEKTLLQAIGIEAQNVHAWFHLGVAQQQQGKLAEASESLRRAITLHPEHVDALIQLGITLARMGHQGEGAICLQDATRLCPSNAMAHNNLGVALAELGRPGEALASWRKAVELEPRYSEAHFNLAVALADNQKLDEAAAHYETALQLKPDYAEAYCNLGLVRVEQGRSAEGVILLEQALRLKPDYTDAYNNLGLALTDLGRPEDGMVSYREALRRRPNDADAHNNLGTAFSALGRLEEALACYEQALRLKPGYPEVHWHRALAWLQQGDYSRGWPEYEWRWKRRRARPRSMERPLWDRGPLEGKTILLWCEQGVGDTLQFIRYAPLVKARGGRVIVECQAGLLPLLRTCEGIDQWVAERTELPPFDVHLPLMSLPGIFQTTLASIPAQVPYLHAEAERTEKWQRELTSSSGKNFKIGIAWQGNPLHRWDRHRSFALEHFHVLAQLPGVQLYSLQKGPGTEQVEDFARRFPLVDLGGQLDQDAMFVDTAAVMKSLDLVITCDSALAHLAGALGVPVWVALSAMSDWRWLKDRSDSPWYPSMRLFRQKKLGGWKQVFKKTTKELTKLLQQRPA